MVENALRRRLEPIVARHRHLHLARRLALYWLIVGLLALALVVIGWLWGWYSSLAVVGLVLAAIVATIIAVRQVRRMEPDYQAIARSIEQQHPDLKALLLAAVEQEPEGPDGQFGYLQLQVLTEAVVHATRHDWLASISTRKLVLSDIGWIAALIFLLAVLSQALPGISLGSRDEGGLLTQDDFTISVSPGDTSVEAGSSVVVVARFEGRVPPEATLAYGPSGEEPQRVVLNKPLNDPVFGGIIPQVRNDLIYHVEYAGRRTPNYTIGIFEYPRLVKADAKIVYPSYTNLPEKVIEDTRRVSAVEGSEITLTFTLNKPVTSARLVPRAGIAVGLSLDSEHANVVTTTITAAKSERYELVMSDAQGLSNKVPPRFVVDVFENLPPQITPTFPNRDVVASPLEELNLEAKVMDDYGLTGYGLTFTLAGTQSRDVPLRPTAQSKDELQMQYLLALEELNAEPDQLLTYYFWADDVGPNGKPRRTSSDIYFAEVRPFEEVFRESQSFQDGQEQQQREQQDQSGQQQGQQQAEQLARLQKQIISATWNIKQRADLSGSLDDSKEDLEVVRDSQADALEQARAAAAEAQDPSATQRLLSAAEFMETSLEHLSEAVESAAAQELTPALGAEQSAYQELLRLRDREHQVAQGRSNASNRSSSNSAQFDRQLQQLELTQQENRYETQRLAQAQEQTQQREDLQVLNRLRDLARRQNDVSDRLREAEAALRQAQNEQQREEALRELRRLRDEQLEAVRDVDELQQRMEQPQNRQRMADAREQLEQSRSEIRQSAEQLQEGMVSDAVSSATRAQRQLEQVRDEFQRNTSGQFVEEMRNMREQAQQLDRQQQEIGEQLRQQTEERGRRLTDSDGTVELANQINQQRDRVQELLDRMREVSDESEASEPLLSRRLYDTFREASTENIDDTLGTTEELLRRRFIPEAQETEQQAARAISEMREGIEEAATGVLGDEAESLRLAQQQLDDLIRQVDEEAARARQGRGGDPNALASGDPNRPRMASAAQERRPGDPREGQQPGQGQPQQDQPQEGQASANTSDPQPGQQEGQAQANAQGQGGQRQGGDRQGQPQEGQQGGNRVARGNEPRQGGQQGGRQDNLGGRGGAFVNDEWIDEWGEADARGGPLTGEDFLQWSDRLRDVEEMLPEEELRNEAAVVRDRARAVRAEFTRHGVEPQWDLVREQITRPLVELRQRVGEKLAQLKSDEALVPIDRDPVPGRYAEAVRRYFENLGDETR
ncbi:MAG: hypothetical protein JW993_21005 [Sedimentisphaerales bacterium]|nr:hypothetical protein [Sedimentisphaerales bacterium]